MYISHHTAKAGTIPPAKKGFRDTEIFERLTERLSGVSIMVLILLTGAFSLIAYLSAEMELEAALLGSLVFTVIYSLSLVLIAIVILFVIATTALTAYTYFSVFPLAAWFGGEGFWLAIVLEAVLGGIISVLVLAASLILSPPLFLGQGMAAMTGSSLAGWIAGTASLVIILKYVPFRVLGYIMYSIMAACLAHIITFLVLADTTFRTSLNSLGGYANPGLDHGIHALSEGVANVFKLVQPPPLLYLWIIAAGVLMALKKRKAQAASQGQSLNHPSAGRLMVSKRNY